MSDKKSKKTHTSPTSLVEAVGNFLSKLKAKEDASRYSKLSDIAIDLQRLQAAYEAELGIAPGPQRVPYTSGPTPASPGRVEGYEERHESFGVVKISRVSGYARLFGSAIQHTHFIRLAVKRAVRKVATYDDLFWESDMTPVIEIDMTGAQFVEMISSMGSGQNTPVTIKNVDGVHMDEVPEGLGSALGVMEKMFEDSLSKATKDLGEHTRELEGLVGAFVDRGKLSKTDANKLMEPLRRFVRFSTDTLPYFAKQFGDHSEKVVAKSKAEVEATVSAILHGAGVKSIIEGGGDLPRLADGKAKKKP
jgi:hypothetical protein